MRNIKLVKYIVSALIATVISGSVGFANELPFGLTKNMSYNEARLKLQEKSFLTYNAKYSGPNKGHEAVSTLNFDTSDFTINDVEIADVNIHFFENKLMEVKLLTKFHEKAQSAYDDLVSLKKFFQQQGSSISDGDDKMDEINKGADFKRKAFAVRFNGKPSEVRLYTGFFNDKYNATISYEIAEVNQMYWNSEREKKDRKVNKSAEMLK